MHASPMAKAKGKTMTAELLLILVDVPVNVPMGKVAHRPSGREGKAHGERPSLA